MYSLMSILCLIISGATEPDWQSVETGFALMTITTDSTPVSNPSEILIVRFDPAHWQLTLLGPPARASDGQTARQWAEQEGLAAAINAGMFATDYLTHVGYMEHEGRTISRRINHYQSVAAFNPRDPEKSPPFALFDLDDASTSIDSIRAEYTSLVQNLRLIKKPAINRWSQQDRRWSEAALGEDESGNVLFVFCRSPFSMHELNALLISADIGLVALQHLEGGPEAQLYLNLGEKEIELFGSYETGFRENDNNAIPWPIPNVIGVRPRQATDLTGQ